MRKIGVRGFKVVQDGKGKATLERDKFYGRGNASSKIKQKTSKKVRVISHRLGDLFSKDLSS